MGDAKEPSAHSCGEPSIDSKTSNKTATDKRKWEPFRHMRRKHRACFSDPITSLELTSLSTEVEGIDMSSAKAGHEDCSTSTIDCLEPSVESIESAESEIISSKASSLSDTEHQPNLATIVHWRSFIRLLKKGPGIPSQSLPPLKPKLTRKKSKRIRDEMVPQLCSVLDAELCCFKSTWKNFSLSELQEATNNFSHENLIGEGGYAEVYKGQLKSGKFVAIKRLTRGSPEEMTMDFLSELGIIVHVDHPNIAKVIGYGVEGGMHLVLQLSPHGSLASLLYGPKEKLNWGIRFKIAVGAAEGLSYLHEGCQRRIIHKDIKASNILLTENFDAQISDFGLAKWLPDQWTHHIVSKVEGTFGYLPPEFFMHGIVDEKTDVYAFGVLLLELITGRQAVDSSQQSLVMWAKPLIKENKIEELVDPTLGDAYDSDQMKRVTATASICIHQSAVNRPQMSQVVNILKGDLNCLETLMQRENSVLERTYSEEIYDADDYNSTKFLNDLNSQMEILLRQSEDA
ncbi:receptor-like cytosolic serine/threonine-protein kinase RBK2 [Durio zibethinus]|uniref:non-specific serine/threonine protein kinase n=1 Tax=Durio zibethinus TaxID=66656 RepID=A0A6P5X426_DURZI|nr:receptor-like cytosolic serine/threonine-protein kinase RBK2 [Durio zibethinus]